MIFSSSVHRLLLCLLCIDTIAMGRNYESSGFLSRKLVITYDFDTNIIVRSRMARFDG